MMDRTATPSMSHFGNLGLSPDESQAPEVTNADVEGLPSPSQGGADGGRGISGLGGSCGGSLGGLGGGHGESGLVREESCSNLFLHEPDVQKVDSESCEFEQRYSLVGQGPLGEGTFGLVWRCTPKALAAPLRGPAERAAKIVRKARLQPRDMRYLLGDDGEIATHLTMKHPNIVELFEYFDEPQSVTLVLEFCRGGDLFDAIIQASKTTGRGFLENAAAVATSHVLSALAYVHGQSVVHRDVKCENVLLAQMGVPADCNTFKLCDFGFAAHDRGEGFSDRLGSPDTVAPEVVAGTRYSFPADLWSTGTLVYMMLSATPPFYAPTDHDVLRKVRTGNYSLCGTLWDSVSAPPKHVITSLMTVDAKLRPTAGEALSKAWLKDVPQLQPP
uniref:Protein kinase domain-containing protein n=2 Tax=Zooxanthella nutricula TaxID=1333877 RepID=A0A7S2QM02_9DINO